jgi:hypothetical protein
MGKVISTVVHAIGTNPITRPGAASTTTKIAHTGPSTNDGTAGGPGYTAGTSGYWLDANGNYVSMTDGTVYCGAGNSLDCELSILLANPALAYSTTVFPDGGRAWSFVDQPMTGPATKYNRRNQYSNMSANDRAAALGAMPLSVAGSRL